MKHDGLHAYFSVADEIFESESQGADQSKPTRGLEPLTLADLDPQVVEEARAFAQREQAPWPPFLPWAEERALEQARGAKR